MKFVSSAKICVLLILVSFWSGLPLAAQQTGLQKSRVIDLPQGSISRIPSPNGKWILVFECPDDCKERKLWIEETRSHVRRAVREFERSLSISWAPNSEFFFVNDASGSADTRCYIYEAATLREIDLEKVILASDVRASQFLNSGHSYLKAKHWINSQELLVILEGHNDGAPPRGFTLWYRVTLAGIAVKISEHVEK